MELDELLDRLEALLAEIQLVDDALRQQVFELLDGVDALHRMALGRLGDELGAEAVANLRRTEPAIAWLFDAYAVGVDEKVAAEAALETVRPYVHSHGGSVEVLGADAGVVRVRLAGACAGCTASAATLRDGVDKALREGFPGYVGMEVEEDRLASPHPPPTVTAVELTRRRR